MARVKIQVDQAELTRAIEIVEAAGPLVNRDQLHKAVAASDWAKNYTPKPITASVVALRIKEFGIEPKTPLGRRCTSRVASDGQTVPTRAKTKAEKMATPRAIEIFNHLAENAPQSFQLTIERARKGSMAAAVRLNCAACMGFESVASNVRDCSSRSCPLWPFRPYQQITVDGELTDDSIEDGYSDELDSSEQLA